MFSLVVDDFGVKCEGIQHAKHLKESLEHHYKVAVDWKGRLFVASNLIGTTTYNMLICLYPDTSKEISPSTNIPTPKNRNIPLTKNHQSATGPKCNIPFHRKRPPHFPLNKSNASKTLSVPSYGMAAHVIQH